MSKTIFKVGDRVFDYRYGWGEIVDITPIYLDLEVSFNMEDLYYTAEGKDDRDNLAPSLSFTEYNLVNGGFSQERPLPEIEKDTPIYVRDSPISIWYIRYFSHWGTSSNDSTSVECFYNQRTSKEEYKTRGWDYWSLTNPLKK